MPSRLLVSVAFMLLLALPGLQMITGAVPVAALEENRVPAPLPPLAGLVHPARYLAALQSWFGDHYGLRPLLIRAKTQADYSLFAASDRLQIGHHGFLFYRSVIDQSEPVIEAMTDAELDRVVGFFGRLRDWLAVRNIRLVVMTAQLKDRFYPQELPREARFAARRHRFDDFRARMAALPGVTYLDTTPGLLALERERPVFHKTDFHWNDPAAFMAAAWLVNTIGRLDGQPQPVWRHELRIVHRPFSGGQALFMPLFDPPQEDALFVAPSWDEAAIGWNAHVPPFEWRARGVGPLPGTVIFGDSFTGGMLRSGLPLYFSSLSYARLYGVPLDTVLQALPDGTKYLVVEFVEISMPSFADMALPK